MESKEQRAVVRRLRSWPMTRRVERQAALFTEMMERAEIAPGAVAREKFAGGFAAARRRCVVCPMADECRRWLDEGSAGAVPDFCPNAAFLERARQRAIRPHRT